MTNTVKWMATGLVVSVAFNVFVLGFFAGRGIDGGWAADVRAGATGPEPDFVLRTLARQLPEPARGDLRRAFRERRAELRPAFLELGEVRGRLAELLTAEAYDQQAVRETMAELRQVEARLKRPVHETVAEALVELSPDQRRAFVETIAHRRRNGHRGTAGDSR